MNGAERDPSQVHAPALAACEAEEALQIFELIKNNFLLSQVFFELTRETPNTRAAPSLHAFSLAEILRHTRLAAADRLLACFDAIDRAFQTIRNDPEATLFGFDQYGHVYVQRPHRSIRQAWEQVLAVHSPAEQGPAPGGNRRRASGGARTSRDVTRRRPRSREGLHADDLSGETAFIIEKAHEYDAEVPADLDEATSSNAANDDEREILQDGATTRPRRSCATRSTASISTSARNCWP